MTFGPPPEYGDDLAPERPVKRVKLSLREHVRSILAEQPPVDLRAEVQAVLREMLAEPETRVKLQGPPGPQGQSVIGAGGGGGLTIGGVPVHSLAAGSGITLSASSGQGTVTGTAGGGIVSASVHLTTANILSLNSAKTTLVAGAANKTPLLVGPLVIVYYYNSIAFTTSATQLGTSYETGLGPIRDQYLTDGLDIFTSAQDGIAIINPSVNGGSAGSQDRSVWLDAAGSALYLDADANFAAGDGDADVYFRYVLITTSF